MQDCAFVAPDGRRLVGRWYGAEAPRAVAVMAGAMGVRQTFYGPFSSHLAQNGISTLTFDYRGVFDSRGGPIRQERASMLDWAELDLPSAVRFAAEREPGLPVIWIGHSLGGQLMGFCRSPIHAALFVGSQSGYWGNWPGPSRWGMRAFWSLMPRLVDFVGFLPMEAVRQGENVPKQVAKDWADWGRKPGYLTETAEERGALYRSYSGWLRSYALRDDRYAPVASVEALVRMYPKARSELRVVSPGDFGLRSLGHFGFFKRTSSALWLESSEWLLGTLQATGRSGH